MSDSKAPLPLASPDDILGGVVFACKKNSYLIEVQLKKSYSFFVHYNDQDNSIATK